MKLRAISILTILAGLGTAGVAYYQWSVQIPALVQQRDAEKGEKDREVTAHAKTTAELASTTTDLNQRKQELASAKAQQQNALARGDAQEKRANNLQGKVEGVNSDLQDTQKLLAQYKASGLNPDETVSLERNLLSAQRQHANLANKIVDLNREYADARERLALYVYDPGGEPIPYGLKGNVVTVDPKWSFAVLNVGESQGVARNTELLVSRQGKLVGKLVVTDVQKNRCIADIVPQWTLGAIMEGDLVTPANPSYSLSLDSNNLKSQAQ